MNLPYFQGMSKDEITSILDKVKLEFLRYNDGELILKQGEPCGCFTGLVRGEDMQELLRMSVAAGTASITTSGTNLFYRDKYEEIYSKICAVRLL